MKVVEEADNGQYLWFCPGCRNHHFFQLAPKKPDWTWNGDYEKPTVNPSILVRYCADIDDFDKITDICHCFIREGRIEYLGDCTHKLAGQTVEMVDIDLH